MHYFFQSFLQEIRCIFDCHRYTSVRRSIFFFFSHFYRKLDAYLIATDTRQLDRVYFFFSVIFTGN